MLEYLRSWKVFLLSKKKGEAVAALAEHRDGFCRKAAQSGGINQANAAKQKHAG